MRKSRALWEQNNVTCTQATTSIQSKRVFNCPTKHDKNVTRLSTLTSFGATLREENNERKEVKTQKRLKHERCLLGQNKTNETKEQTRAEKDNDCYRLPVPRNAQNQRDPVELILPLTWPFLALSGTVRWRTESIQQHTIHKCLSNNTLSLKLWVTDSWGHGCKHFPISCWTK